MQNPIAPLINRIARLFSKWIQMLIAIIISILLFQEENGALKYETVITTLWVLFIILSTVYSVNGFLLGVGFKSEIKKFLKLGKPLKGISGFEELEDSIKASQKQSYLITISSVLSFILYYYVIILNNPIGNIGPTLALAMAFVAISVMFLVDYPEDPSLTPGGLVGFYEPDVFPLTLDNLMTDVFLAYLDPVTSMKFDDWQFGILDMLNPEFEADEETPTRMERAVEKILLLAYLSFSNEGAFPKQVVERELGELLGTNLKDFLKGKGVGLTWKEIVSVVQRIERRAPEPFRLVDRIMIELTDNYNKFTKDDLYFTVAGRSNQGSVTESSGLIAFFINKTTQEDRDIKVWYRTDMETIHPQYQEVNITLDPLTDPFPKEQPKFIAEGDEVDVLTLLSSMLQVGDAVWFRLQPKGFGYRMIVVYAEEEGKEVGDRSPTMGQSFEMRFTKSMSWYIKAYLPKLSGAAGVALPAIKAALGF
ncbi:MAG: hypothetical protein INQ03_13965 [Candidatus Heimdallarchaeota archaeon]|nr:hypothetical protein [Candidatus Heimdallarchaeota archaeon]